MSFWDYVPIVATIKHYIDAPKGRDPTDYIACKMDPSICGGDLYSVNAAKATCEKCITAQLAKYIEDYVGGGGVTGLAGGVVSIGLSALVGAATKKLLAKGASTAAVAAAGGVTVVLAIDGLADLYITISKMYEMYKAAQKAPELYCTCPPGQ